MNLKGPINAIVLAWGWRRWLIAFVAGALSALAMAPFNAWPILFLTFPTLVWLIDGAGVGRWGGVFSAARGWWFGFGYFVAGLYWLGYAFLVDAPTFGWLLPFAVIGLPAVLALFTGFGVALARLLWTRGGTRILALGVSLTAGMAARPSAHRLSLERLRLCAHVAARFSAKRVRGRHLGPDLYRDCGFRDPRHAHRRPQRNAACLAAARARHRGARRAWRLRRVAALPHPDAHWSTKCICASCSPICSRMSASITPPGRR